MSYFDLHCHPTFKYSLLSTQARQGTTIDQPVNIRFKGLLASLQGLVMWTLGSPLGSQSCLTQLATGQARLISLTIMALENAYTKSKIISTLQCVSDALDTAKIDQIKNGALGYWAATQEQIDALRQISNGTLPISPGTPRLRLINDIADYQPNQLNTLFVLLNFEGGHCFYTGQANDTPTLAADILGNLIALKRTGVRPLYITLVHHAQNALANHAFAVPTQWAGAGTNINGVGGYNPTSDGITPLGEQFIDEALSERNGPPIYIDVKHMSLGSRIAYYDLRKLKYPTVPIIASHIGVTGLSWNATQQDGKPIIRWVSVRTDYVEVKYNNIISYPHPVPAPIPGGAPPSVITFNPWSINLYDEDIVEILQSDGLIGLSLDVRILGMGNDRQVAHEHEAERFSMNEQTFAVDDHLTNGQNDFDHPAAADRPDPIQASLAHVEYLCNNLLHIVRVGRAVVGERVWEHLCVGSDLDGLVVSIEYRNNQRTQASNMPDLREAMKQALPTVANKMGVQLAPAGQPVGPFIEWVLNGFFLNNALQFLNRHFRRVPASMPHPLA